MSLGTRALSMGGGRAALSTEQGRRRTGGLVSEHEAAEELTIPRKQSLLGSEPGKEPGAMQPKSMELAAQSEAKPYGPGRGTQGMLVPGPGQEGPAASRGQGSAGSPRDGWACVPRHKHQATELPVARSGKYYDEHWKKSVHEHRESTRRDNPPPLLHLPLPQPG